MFYSLRDQGTQYLTNIYMLPQLEVIKTKIYSYSTNVQFRFSFILDLFTTAYSIYLERSRAAEEKLDINI